MKTISIPGTGTVRGKVWVICGTFRLLVLALKFRPTAKKMLSRAPHAQGEPFYQLIDKMSSDVAFVALFILRLEFLGRVSPWAIQRFQESVARWHAVGPILGFDAKLMEQALTIRDWKGPSKVIVLGTASRPDRVGLARFWDLFGQILPRKVRLEHFEPRYQELLEDLMVAREKYPTKWAHRWLSICFCFRMVLIVTESFTLLGDGLLMVVSWIIKIFRWLR